MGILSTSRNRPHRYFRRKLARQPPHLSKADISWQRGRQTRLRLPVPPRFAHGSTKAAARSKSHHLSRARLSPRVSSRWETSVLPLAAAPANPRQFPQLPHPPAAPLPARVSMSEPSPAQHQLSEFFRGTNRRFRRPVLHRPPRQAMYPNPEPVLQIPTQPCLGLTAFPAGHTHESPSRRIAPTSARF